MPAGKNDHVSQSNHTTFEGSSVPSLATSPLPPFVKGRAPGAGDSLQIMCMHLVWSDLGAVERKTNEIHSGLTWRSRFAVRQGHAVVVILAREAKVLSLRCAHYQCHRSFRRRQLAVRMYLQTGTRSEKSLRKIEGAPESHVLRRQQEKYAGCVARACPSRECRPQSKSTAASDCSTRS